ncbi:hypothetical protein [Falsirhodobacter sp. 20TX0035]|uniref:hypothetical protein n=1 Tax=Falsirhodobacter sp. 20TX0035 TaxID=3022019 RepID=UPI00232F4D3A|nr:hypothetical protein [Falsirhodobacter sp. 20TX0035]MDB6454226.1 hypothetical protein [Falsirhodobacter sp. 20TX0035]
MYAIEKPILDKVDQYLESGSKYYEAYELIAKELPRFSDHKRRQVLSERPKREAKMLTTKSG